MGCGEATRHREEPQQNSAASEASATGAPLIPPARPICDGSDAFTFELLNLANQAGAGLDLAWRNGFHYLRVDGHCHYFAYARLRNDAVVTGSLTEAEATALAQETGYASWPELNGLVAAGGLVDGDTQALHDGEN